VAQQELVDIADRLKATETAAPTTPTLEQFLFGLRTSWRDGEVCPTNRPKQKAPRGRRRPDHSCRRQHAPNHPSNAD
jgi:hypothetical protein